MSNPPISTEDQLILWNQNQSSHKFNSQPEIDSLPAHIAHKDSRSEFEAATRSELPFRDNVGYFPPSQTNSPLPQLFLPTSLTYKISNELDTLTSVEISNHGAFLAVGTSSGLIRLYCFGRTPHNNDILEKLDDRLVQNTLNQAFAQPLNNDPVDLPYHTSSASWDRLIDRGIDITPVELTKHRFIQEINQNSASSKLTPHTLTSMSIPASSTPNISATATTGNLANTASTAQSTQPIKSASQSAQTTPSSSPTSPLNLPFQVHELTHHQTPITGLQFSPCLSFLLSVDQKGVIALWALSTDYSHALNHLKTLQFANMTANPSATGTTTSTTTNSASTLSTTSSAPARRGKIGLKSKKDPNEQSTNAMNDQPLDPQPQSDPTPPPSSSNPTTQLTITSQTAQINQDTINPPQNQPVVIRTWTSFPSTFNALSLSSLPGSGYFAISHQSVGISIYRTDLTDPVKLIPYIPKSNATPNTMFTPGSLLTWSPNGYYLAIAYEQGVVAIYAPFENALPVRHVKLHGRCTALSFTPCGRFLFTADSVMMMAIWDLNPPYSKTLARQLWVVNPATISTDPIVKTLLPEQLIEVSLPLHPVRPLFESYDPRTQPMYTPLIHESIIVPIYPNKGTIHTDYVTSVSFSYPNAAQLTAQLASTPIGKDPSVAVAVGPETFPYLITTSSLDGTTKIWHPFFHRTVQPLLPNESGCILAKDLLQTIYTQQNPVQKVKFTSRNLLMIVTTDHCTKDVSTLREAL